MPGELPVFSGRLLEDFEDWRARLLAFLRLQPDPVSEQQQKDWLLLSIQPGSAAATALKNEPTDSTFEEALAHLGSSFSSPRFRELAHSAASNTLKFRRFRDAEHPHELAAQALDDVDRYGRALRLDDAELRESLLRCFSEFPYAPLSILAVNRPDFPCDDSVCSSLLAKTSTYVEAQECALNWENRVAQRFTFTDQESKRLSFRQIERMPSTSAANRLSTLTGSFPSPPVLAPLPPTPKRPLSQISLQEISTLPRLNLNLDNEPAESLCEQLSAVSASTSSSALSAATTAETVEVPSTKPPRLSLSESSFQALPQKSPQPQPTNEVQQPARPRTAPASPSHSHPSSPATSYRTSCSTTNTPLTPASPHVEKQMPPLPADGPTSARSFTSISSQSTGKLPPDHPYIRRVAPVPFPADQHQPAIRLQHSKSASETGSEDEDLDQSKLFYHVPEGGGPKSDRARSPTTPNKLRRKSLSARTPTPLGMQPPQSLDKSSSGRLSKILGARSRAWSYADS